ncbi:hypothetical protein Avbf_17566 [Armadillidium vulgare]|nr:hypothetical protein Avbf_17566 [Armadillidium vulgare]
MYMQHF